MFLKQEIDLPTAITHVVVAAAAGKIYTNRKMPERFWMTAIFCSVVPDADVIGFSFGIRYGDFFGHRGFFHSIFFAFILSFVLTAIFFRDRKIFSPQWWKYVLFFFAVGASHGILDAFTNGGLGIALLSPFDNSRYFFPWTPIQVSPIGLRMFLSRWGLEVIACEIKYIWLPLLLIYAGSLLLRKAAEKKQNHILQ